MWRASVITLFPEMFPGPLSHSLIGKALGECWSLDTVNLRDFGRGNHHAVDDTPAGGGPGMVLRADVAAAALDSLAEDGRVRLVMTPRGRQLKQKHVRECAACPGVIILSGRFEGVDERIIEARKLIPVSIGDYILAGGDVAAMALIEACVRLLPGVMGKEESGLNESFENGLLEHAQYTKPSEFEGLAIPPVLLSGDHAKIASWREEEAEAATRLRRPDLWQAYEGGNSSPHPTSGLPDVGIINGNSDRSELRGEVRWGASSEVQSGGPHPDPPPAGEGIAKT